MPRNAHCVRRFPRDSTTNESFGEAEVADLASCHFGEDEVLPLQHFANNSPRMPVREPPVNRALVARGALSR